MILLDTHVWLWWVSDDRRLSARATVAIDRAEVVGVSVVSCYEVAWLAQHQRIRLELSVREWMARAFRGPLVQLVPVSLDAAMRAAQFGPIFTGDPIDRLITATALTIECPLVTADERILDSGVVETIW